MARAWMSWSSGKDSTFALHRARADGVDVRALLTTITAEHDRVTMHAVRRPLLEAQAATLGLPLVVIELPSPCPNELYEEKMAGVVQRARDDGIEAMVFGDLFLEDVRAYRVRQLGGTGIEPVFPLFGADTARLAAEMLDAGVVATITCADPAKVDAALAGRRWDAALIASLPKAVDPCGENGEFHTFASDGPGFASPIGVTVGERVERDGFAFCDLLPV
jgi:uncharacterized protein (TIGR00290 family)